MEPKWLQYDYKLLQIVTILIATKLLQKPKIWLQLLRKCYGLSAVALAPGNESKLYQARKPKIAEGKLRSCDEASTHKLEKPKIADGRLDRSATGYGIYTRKPKFVGGPG